MLRDQISPGQARNLANMLVFHGKRAIMFPSRGFMSNNVPKHELDTTDRKILRALQDDAGISNVDLARKVALSPSPCLRRVQRLEELGVIRRRVTLLEPAAV